MKARTDYIRIAAGCIACAVFIAHIGCASVTTTYLTTPTPHEEYIIAMGEGGTWQDAVDKAIRKAVDHFGVDIKAEELIVNRRLVGETVQINRDGWIAEYTILSEEKKEDKIVVAMQVLVIAKEDIENRKKLKEANQQVVGSINTVGEMVGDIGGGVLAAPLKTITGTFKSFIKTVKREIDEIQIMLGFKGRRKSPYSDEVYSTK
ncbi:MAG: hypothetical protein AABY79_08795 [Nitrospirota bacterium]